MGTLNSTVRAGVVTANRNTATASDQLTYVPNTNQVLEIHNNSGTALTNVTLQGSAPSAAFAVPGVAGLTVNLSAGYVIPSIPGNTTVHVVLDTIAPYLAGNGTVLVKNATGATVILLTN